MKRLMTLILLGFFSSLIIAAPGGGPDKLESYDYHDYVNRDIQTKTFDHYDIAGILNTEIWSYERPSRKKLIITKIRTDDAGTILRWVDDRFHLTDQSYSWYQQRIYDEETGMLDATRDNIPAIVRMTDNMVPGIAWGTAGVIEINSTYNDHFTDKSELLGIEDVVVPKETYTDCLKIHRLHDYGALRSRIEWVCPGLGLVKRVLKNNWLELTDVTFEE